MQPARSKHPGTVSSSDHRHKTGRKRRRIPQLALGTKVRVNWEKFALHGKCGYVQMFLGAYAGGRDSMYSVVFPCDRMIELSLLRSVLVVVPGARKFILRNKDAGRWLPVKPNGEWR